MYCRPYGRIRTVAEDTILYSHALRNSVYCRSIPICSSCRYSLSCFRRLALTHAKGSFRRMPAQPQDAAKPMMDHPSVCTCGHHYGRTEEEDKNDDNGHHHRQQASAVSANSMIMAQSYTAATVPNSINTTTSNIGNGLHRPLDASFVQVPQHDYRNDPILQQLHQEEQQKHGAATTSSFSPGDFGKAEYYLRLIRLEQAAKAGSSTSEDATPPPPLCLSCIQRYVEFGSTHILVKAPAIFRLSKLMHVSIVPYDVCNSISNAVLLPNEHYIL